MLHTPRPPVGARPVPPRTPGGLFRPRPRGDLAKALSSRRAMEVVAPESPRPSEMMEGVTVNGEDVLTADDAALHELLISHAYAEDCSMPEAMHEIEMSAAIRYLGGRVERSDVRRSLERLKNTAVSFGTPETRRYEDVRLLEGYVEVGPERDVIHYRLPEPLRVLMSEQRAYAYVELAAFPKMRSKFSSRLYRVLALRAKGQPWTPGGENVVTVTATPDEIARWVGFPVSQDGRVHSGKLKERLLNKLEDDFAAVRAFRLEFQLEHGGRGNALRKVTFRLHLSPPERHTVPMFFNPKQDIARIGGTDAPEYRVESRTWRRAFKSYGKMFGMTARAIADMWHVALHEALSGVALTDGYHTRRYRGRRLLDAISARGADYAAWGLACEEADAPDLVLKSREMGWIALVGEADEARLARSGKKPAEKPAAPAFIVDDEVEKAVPAKAEQVTFEGCREVILTVDRAMTVHDVESIIAPAVKSWTYTGTRVVTVTLRYWVGGAYDRWTVGAFLMSEADLDGLQRQLYRYLDGPEELA